MAWRRRKPRSLRKAPKGMKAATTIRTTSGLGKRNPIEDLRAVEQAHSKGACCLVVRLLADRDGAVFQ